MCDGQAHVRSASLFQGVAAICWGPLCETDTGCSRYYHQNRIHTHDLSGMTVAEVPSAALQLQLPNMVLQCVSVFTVSM